MSKDAKMCLKAVIVVVTIIAILFAVHNFWFTEGVFIFIVICCGVFVAKEALKENNE